MQFDTIVKISNPYEAQSMVDPIAVPLPMDVLPIIFKNVKADLPHLTSPFAPSNSLFQSATVTL